MTDLFANPCPDCTAAALGPHWGFKRACQGCEARAIARGPDFHRCRVAGRQDREYRALLANVGISHDAVVKAAEADKERTCGIN